MCLCVNTQVCLWPCLEEEFPAGCCPRLFLDWVKAVCVASASVLILELAHVLEVIRELKVPVYETTELGTFFWQCI